MKARGISSVALALIILVATGAPGAATVSAQGLRAEGGPLAWIQRLWQGDEPADHRGGPPTILVDEDGRRVTATGLAVGVGDQYIAGDNRMYEIVAVDGDIARVKFVEVVRLPSRDDYATEDGDAVGHRGAGEAGSETEPSSPLLPGLLRAWTARSDEAASRPPLVAIYHSHNAESYVETSGKEFAENGPGDIHQVGRTLKEALEKQGLQVEWSGNLHLPHDGGAYRRSRATVRRFLRKRPAAMIDVHRDATPADMYRTEVDGKPMTKVRLVVGRQNHNREANLQYAKEIKAIADERFPGLIEGIFHARGNYNQDVGPRTILLEFGTHETSLEEAEASAQLMAQVIPATLGGPSQQRVGGSGWRSAGWLLLLAVLGVLAYMRINAGSWAEFRDRLLGLLRLKRIGSR